MCNHCGCRAFAPIDELMAEHEVLLALAWTIAEATRAGETPSSADFEALSALLDLHITKEETGLYPELVDAGGVSVGVVGELEEEHRAVRRSLAARSFDRSDYYELALHIETEEEVLFPMTQFGFDEDDWDTVAHAYREAEVVQAAAGRSEH